ncbi:hypothetical protein GH714_013272 [Hevea brasiliensis]|uniref:Uncharacterized protein n=1 Tax=Hevea brasiliensis TaxID=3981 RepID=A0A6A6KIP5_HEVBR|nr:hypothetical protein GH714_013272 [Hevea brasiliensis]
MKDEHYRGGIALLQNETRMAELDSAVSAAVVISAAQTLGHFDGIIAAATCSGFKTRKASTEGKGESTRLAGYSRRSKTILEGDQAVGQQSNIQLADYPEQKAGRKEAHGPEGGA